MKDFTWDRKLQKYVVDKHYYKYSKEMQSGIIPTAFLPMLLHELDLLNISYKLDTIMPVPTREVNASMRPTFEDKPGQTETIEFLINNKNPVRCLALQTGCLTGDSDIRLNRGHKGFSLTLEDVYLKFNGLWTGVSKPWNRDTTTYTRSFDGTSIKLNEIEGVVKSGIQEVYKLTLKNGLFIKCTANHPVLTEQGWKSAEFCVGQMVMCDTLLPVKSENPRGKQRQQDVRVGPYHPYGRKLLGVDNFRIAKHRAIYEAHHLNGMTLEEFLIAVKDIHRVGDMTFLDPAVWAVHHKDHDPTNNHPDNLVQMIHEEHLKHHGKDSYGYFNQGVPTYSECVDFQFLGEEETYDIICKYPNNNFVANGMVVHNSGKTYCAIKAAVLLKTPFLIVTSGLVEQWNDCVNQYTTIEPDDIYVIRGAKSILALMKMERKPTCIIASLETIRNFAQLKGDYEDIGFSIMDMMIHLGIGIKINDECHDNFHGIMSIDLMINIPINIYLSATYIRNNPSTKKIFNTIFPKDIRYGEDAYEKYADVMMHKYSSFVPDKTFSIGGSYSHYKYENYIFKEDRRIHWWMYYIVRPIIDERFIQIRKPHQRMLMLMAKIDNIKLAVTKLREFYPNLTILPYTMNDPDVNLEADIIVSTIGSAGTGLDIPNLVHCFNTVSIAAEGKVLQIVGRLRKLKDGSQVYMSDLFNDRCDAHVRHMKERELVYISRAKIYTVKNI